jgi:hypothetical protein
VRDSRKEIIVIVYQRLLSIGGDVVIDWPKGLLLSGAKRGAEQVRGKD